MDIDVNHQLNAVHRRVGSRVLAPGTARTVTISQTYQAPVEEVWDACTNPERIPRWFLPVSGDLRVGGTPVPTRRRRGPRRPGPRPRTPRPGRPAAELSPAGPDPTRTR